MEGRSILPGVGPPPSIRPKIGVQHMIAPATVDLKVALRDAFIFESGLFKDPARGIVFGQACGLDPAEVEGAKRVMHDRFDGFTHISLPRMGFADPIAQGPGLCRPTPDIVERDGAQQGLAFAKVDEQWHGGAL